MNLLSIVFVSLLTLSLSNNILHRYAGEGKYSTNITFTVQLERTKGQYLWVSLQSQLEGFNKESLNQRRQSQIIKVIQFVENYNKKSLKTTKNKNKNANNKKGNKNQSEVTDINSFQVYQTQRFDIQTLEKGYKYYYLEQILEIRVPDSKLIGKFIDQLLKFLQTNNLKLLIASIRWDAFDLLDKAQIPSVQIDSNTNLNKSNLRSKQEFAEAKLLFEIAQLEAKKRCDYLNMELTSLNDVQNLENISENSSTVQFKKSNWLQDLDEFQFQEMTYLQMQQVRLELQFQEYDTSVHEVNAMCSSTNQSFKLNRSNPAKKEKLKSSIKQKEQAKPQKQVKSSKQKNKKGGK